MNPLHNEDAPEWAVRFLEALKAGEGVRAAARAAGVTNSTPYHRRANNEAFRRAWDACQPADARRNRRIGPARPRDAAKYDRFIAELAETSNVSAAAAAADVTVSMVYKLRRTDPLFARRWYAALAEGYDNLEMELLGRLREGEAPESGAAGGAAQGPRRRFDTATALRCLTAHRESVAREKGRHTLAQEVATIASLNAKIDAMRLRRATNRKVIAEAFAKVEARTGAKAGAGAEAATPGERDRG